jgi:hypothetical protein
LSDADLQEEAKIDEIEVSKDLALLLLDFTAPRICLELMTTKKALSSTKLKSEDLIDFKANSGKDKEDAKMWQLITNLDHLSLKMEQYNDRMTLEANVKSLKVSDNSGDRRF